MGQQRPIFTQLELSRNSDGDWEFLVAVTPLMLGRVLLREALFGPR